jgi:diguanylate cyclase (GGDEF)-like protein
MTRTFAVLWVSGLLVADHPSTASPTSGHEALIALATTAQDLSHAASLDDVQRVVRNAGRSLTGADGMALVLLDGVHCVYVDEDAIAPLWKGRRVPMASDVSGWTIRTGEAAVVEDVYADDRTRQAAYRRTFVKSLLMVPIAAREALGAIGFYWAERHTATETETAIARALAASTAVALDNVRLSQEVERRRNTEEDLRELCERDPLTGLLNRRAWDLALTGALRKRRRSIHVALLDLDRFKSFNDRHGHPAGDELLRRTAIAWRGALRHADVLARYGGEEFAILLANCDRDSALDIVDRVRRATVDDETVSIGIAQWDGDESGDELIMRADRALYAAKRAGRDRVVLAP